MKLSKLVLNSLRHYAKAHLAIVLGVAISTAVITGALIVGDSVSYSLHQAAAYRLGEVKQVVSGGDRFFGTSLRDSLRKHEADESFSALLQLDAVASAGGGEKRLNRVQVLGIDQYFAEVIGKNFPYDSLKANDVVLSKNTAEALEVQTGDRLLLKIRKASPIPVNAPFVSDEEQSLSRRVRVAAIVEKEQAARFDLSNSQTAPYNVFVPHGWLADEMEMPGKANLLLSNSNELAKDKIRSMMNLQDRSVELNKVDSAWMLTSERVFIDQVYATAIEQKLPEAQAHLTYFVNHLAHDSLHCPYSFVSTDKELRANEIRINSWLAEDLGAKPGDHIHLQYFVVGPLRKLDTASASFVVKSIVPLENTATERSLMPDFPGLSDAGNCRDWETGVPVDLDAIRDKDEDYWDDYKGIPKAYISLEKAQELWSNRFGAHTAFRFLDTDSTLLFQQLHTALDPFEAGFQIINVQERSRYAAENGTDFSSLFIGLSFFIIVAGLLLTVLLFRFNLDQRKSQNATLRALGFSDCNIRRIWMREAWILAVVGALPGLLLAVLYNHLVFHGLNGVWQDIVRTQVLEVDVRPLTLIMGFVISVFTSVISIRLGLQQQLKQEVAELHQAGVAPAKSMFRKLKIGSLFFLTGLVAALLLSGAMSESALFFVVGGALLLAFIILADLYLKSSTKSVTKTLSVRRLSWLNLRTNPRRSLMVVILLSLGSFLVVSTGANRKDLFANATKPDSGTGGFALFAESTLPVLKDLSDPQVRADFSLSDKLEIVQFRQLPGDDASCLNLNRIERPRVLGVQKASLDGHFRFVSTTEYLNEEQPWHSLDTLIDGLIPAIADQTVIQWSLGKTVGDTLHYTNEKGKQIKLLLVGGTIASVFQGYLLISDKHFLQHYPSSSGSRVFLIGGDTTQATEDFQLAFRDHGWQMTGTVERLANFKSVENTYLTIFLILGVLGLLLGTIGLAVILARSIHERRSELALLSALGYSKAHIASLVVREYFALLLTALVAGTLSALVAVWPSLQQQQDISTGFLIALLALLLINGLFWIALVSFGQLRKLNPSDALREE